MTLEKDTGFYSYIDMKVVTPVSRLSLKLVRVRTSGHMLDPDEAAVFRDAAYVFLTEGRVVRNLLSRVYPADALQFQNDEQFYVTSVQKAKRRIHDYDPVQNVFLLQASYGEFLGTGKPLRDLLVPICFPNYDAAESSNVTLADLRAFIGNELHNAYIFAPAGYGKTHLLNALILAELRAVHSDDAAVWISASTGLAAMSIGGSTLHSLAGVQRGRGEAAQVIAKMKAWPKQRWKTVQVVVIDEVSMLSGRFMKLFDEVARRMKGSNSPFGGIRVIAVGDFGQLPPVPDTDKSPEDVGLGYVNRAADFQKIDGGYAFENEAWQRAHFKCFRLSHCWRYGSDSRLTAFLEKLRSVTYVDGKLLEELDQLVDNDVDQSDAVMLVCTKAEARKISAEKLEGMPGEVMTFLSVDECGGKKRVHEGGEVGDANAEGVAPGMTAAELCLDEKKRMHTLYSSLSAQRILILKVGARVLATQRIGDVPVGSMGVVRSFQRPSDSDLDFMIPTTGLPYGVTPAMVRHEWDLVRPDRCWPSVSFTVGDETHRVLVPPGLHTIEDNIKNVICSRLQVPLVLAYALTVHRAQGMTLDCVIFTVTNVFAPGQLYTGLSRVRSFDRLRVVGSVRRMVAASRAVIEFERSINWHVVDNRPEAWD